MARALRDPRTRALLLVALLLLLCAFTLHHVGPDHDAMAMAFGACLFVLVASGLVLLLPRVAPVPVPAEPSGRSPVPARPLASRPMAPRPPPRDGTVQLA